MYKEYNKILELNYLVITLYVILIVCMVKLFKLRGCSLIGKGRSLENLGAIADQKKEIQELREEVKELRDLVKLSWWQKLTQRKQEK